MNRLPTNRSRECVRRNKQPGYEKMRVEGVEIKCPICGGQLQYWKEYLSQKTQMITFGGEISKKVINTKPDAMDDMQGFECVVCGWIFNTANDIEKYEKYPHFEKWLKDHADELRV